MQTTIGQLLINQALPPGMRDYNRVIDKGSIEDLLAEVADKHPEQYSTILKGLGDVGRHVAYTTGGYSFGLKDLRTAVAAKRVQMELKVKLRELLSDKTLNDKQRDAKILELAGEYQKKLPDEVLAESLTEDNPLARQVVGAGRGNKFMLNSIRGGGDLLYVDQHDQPIPIPVLHNYSQGLTPAEYFAGAFGARKGVADVKQGTADAGFLSKQLVSAAHRLLVSSLDDDDPYDDLSPRGLPSEVGDPGNVGALLSHPVAGYPRNTVLTPRVLKDLATKTKTILVRSPMVGGPDDGGVYARDVGMREKGRIAPLGDYVGVAAANAVGERIAQGSLSSKHSGGVAGASAKSIGGFKALNTAIQVPKTFPGATHAQLDGRIDSIQEAPQGGQYITIGNKQHYVRAGTDLLVKPGDHVEAGDVLSDGLMNPAEFVHHKGIGEGRRYFMNILGNILKNSDIKAERRNVELLSRALINHVRVTDEFGHYLPDDVVPYSALERGWEPRAGTTETPVSSAHGRYLERPILHYTIGTRIGKRMQDELKQHNIKTLSVHHDPPPFEPEMIRGIEQISNDPDWMVRLSGAYQEKGLLKAVHRGSSSDQMGTSFIPPLAEGTSFGLKGPTKGWDANG